MGLRRPDDVAFSSGLRALLQTYEKQFVSEIGVTRFVSAVFESAMKYGDAYPGRVRDWGISIYPNNTPLQQGIFDWQLLIARGGKYGERDVGTAPVSIRRVREILSSFQPIKASQIQPASEWDRQYCAERESEAISPFEWVESAVRTYRFQSAWDVVKNDLSPEQMKETYEWALREADLLRIPRQRIFRPEECLGLPGSLGDH
jgi:hypothetical protein